MMRALKQKLELELMTRRRPYVHAVIQLDFLCLEHLIMFYFHSRIIENCKMIESV